MIRLLSYRFVTINWIRPEINILIDIHFRIRLIIYSKNSQTPSPALFTIKNGNYFLDNFQDVIIITNNRSTVTAFQRVIDSKLPQTAPFPTFPLKNLQNAGENICQAGRGLKYRKLEVIRKKKGRGGWVSSGRNLTNPTNPNTRERKIVERNVRRSPCP